MSLTHGLLLLLTLPCLYSSSVSTSLVRHVLCSADLMSVGDQTAAKTKIVACYLLPLGACCQGYCCQQKSLNMAVLFYIPQFSSFLRY